MELPLIKLAIFDFDDTLALHRDMSYVVHRREENTDEYFKQAYLHPDGFFDVIEHCIAPEYMKNLIDFLREQSVKIHCVSGLRFTLHEMAKQKFIDNHYGNNIRLIGVDSQDRKVEVVHILQSIYNCKPEETLCVDDNYTALDVLKSAGCFAIHRKDVEELTKDGYRICIKDVQD